ncbi:MAG: maltose ABC transporter substrate-binding protein [Caldilineaceae bacterium]|nr:maltose ABC transporter substrate-binding protein [Caldilineaceae bacterium]
MPAPCATAAPAEPAEPAATEAPAEAEAAPAEEVATLTIWADNTRAPLLESLGAEFKEEYGIDIVVSEKAFNDIRDDFKVAAPVGEGPDIIIGAHDWLGELVENGLVAEIDLGANADQFLPAAVQAFTYDGGLYGLPYSTENLAFVYNPEMVTEVPTTWDEVEALAAQLEADGVVKQGFIRQEGDPYHFFPIQTAFGGYVFGLDETGYSPEDVGIDSEGSLAAIAWLDKMYKDGHLLAGSAVDYDIMHAAFEAGDAAMMITGPWALPRIRESGTPFAVTTIPGQNQDAQPFLGVQGFMVNSFSEDPLLAQAFLQEFVAQQDTMQEIFTADPRPSAYVPVRDGIEDPELAAFADAGANGLAMPAIPEMSAVWSSWDNAIKLVSQQNEEPETAFTDAAEQIRAAIAGE